MKKRTKILCGVAILIAIVSMNIRYAWMNYGIYRHVEAGIPSNIQNPCPQKDDILMEYNRHLDSTAYKVHCIAKIVNILEKKDSTSSHTIKETFDYVHDTYTISPIDADKSGFQISTSDSTMAEFITHAYRCGRYAEGECCYDKSAEMDCKVLLKRSATF